mmetsp:Transcript_36935/g.119123  ORF Transcript_36935/g.119123 Transcript_36935/m.119123 type:complete len:287 (+) Transcript_36935:4008-4868(+)
MMTCRLTCHCLLPLRCPRCWQCRQHQPDLEAVCHYQRRQEASMQVCAPPTHHWVSEVCVHQPHQELLVEAFSPRPHQEGLMQVYGHRPHLEARLETCLRLPRQEDAVAECDHLQHRQALVASAVVSHHLRLRERSVEDECLHRALLHRQDLVLESHHLLLQVQQEDQFVHLRRLVHQDISRCLRRQQVELINPPHPADPRILASRRLQLLEALVFTGVPCPIRQPQDLPAWRRLRHQEGLGLTAMHPHAPLGRLAADRCRHQSRQEHQRELWRLQRHQRASDPQLV